MFPPFISPPRQQEQEPDPLEVLQRVRQRRAAPSGEPDPLEVLARIRTQQPAPPETVAPSMAEPVQPSPTPEERQLRRATTEGLIAGYTPEAPLLRGARTPVPETLPPPMEAVPDVARVARPPSPTMAAPVLREPPAGQAPPPPSFKAELRGAFAPEEVAFRERETARATTLAPITFEEAEREARAVENPVRNIIRALGRDVGARFVAQAAQKGIDLARPLGVEAHPILRQIVDTANRQRQAENAGQPHIAAQLTRDLTALVAEFELIPGGTMASQVPLAAARGAPKVLAQAAGRGVATRGVAPGLAGRAARRAAEDAARFGYVEGAVGAVQEPDLEAAAARQRRAVAAGAVIGPAFQGAGEFLRSLELVRLARGQALIDQPEILRTAQRARARAEAQGRLTRADQEEYARAVLGVREGATEAEISQAFRQRATPFHEAGTTPDPDLFKVYSEAAATLRQRARPQARQPEPTARPEAPAETEPQRPPPATELAAPTARAEAPQAGEPSPESVLRRVRRKMAEPEGPGEPMDFIPPERQREAEVVQKYRRGESLTAEEVEILTHPSPQRAEMEALSQQIFAGETERPRLSAAITEAEGLNAADQPGEAPAVLRQAIAAQEAPEAPIAAEVPPVEPAPERPVEAPQRPTAAPSRAPVYQAADVSRETDIGIVRLPVAEIRADPKRFQFKSLGTEGVGPELKGVTRWNEQLAGVVSVWRDPADGKVYVVNGHHRLELAKRLGAEALNVQFIDAATAKEARAAGAVINMAEGRGTATDVAKFLRDANATPEDLANRGVSLRADLVRQGVALSRLAPDLFDQVATAKVPQGWGVAIGELIEDPALQRQALSVAKKAKRLNQAEVREVARQVQAAGAEGVEQETLFGTETERQGLFVPRAKLASTIKQRLAQDKRLFGFVSRGERAAELQRAGETRIDVEAAQALAETSARLEEVFDRLYTRAGPLASLMNAGARRIAHGEAPGTVAAELYPAVGDAVAGEFGQVGTRPDRGEPPLPQEPRAPADATRDASQALTEAEARFQGEARRQQLPLTVATTLRTQVLEQGVRPAEALRAAKLPATGPLREQLDELAAFRPAEPVEGEPTEPVVDPSQSALFERQPPYGEGRPADEAAVQEGLFGERTLAGAEQTELLPETAGAPTAKLGAEKIAPEEVTRVRREGEEPEGERPLDLFPEGTVMERAGPYGPRPDYMRDLQGQITEGRAQIEKEKTRAAEGGIKEGVEPDPKKVTADAMAALARQRQAETRLAAVEVDLRDAAAVHDAARALAEGRAVEPAFDDAAVEKVRQAYSSTVSEVHAKRVFGSKQKAEQAAQLGLFANQVPTLGERLAEVRTAPPETYVELRGKRLAHGQDAATVFAPFRSPKTEKAHWVLLDEQDAIRSVVSASSGAINHVSFLERLPRELEDLKRRAKRVGATHFAFIHNHPSGDPRPSRNDERFHVDVAAQAEAAGLSAGRHYIINGDTVAEIHVTDIVQPTKTHPGAATFTAKKVPVTGLKSDWLVPRRRALSFVGDVVAVAGMPAKDRVDVLYRDGAGRAIAAVPHRLRALETMETWLPAEARGIGAVDAVLIVDGTDVSSYRTPYGQATQWASNYNVALTKAQADVPEILDVVGIAGPGSWVSALDQGKITRLTEPEHGRRPAREAHRLAEEPAAYGPGRPGPESSVPGDVSEAEYQLSPTERILPGEGPRRGTVREPSGWYDPTQLPSVTRTPKETRGLLATLTRPAKAFYDFYSEDLISAVRQQGGQVGQELAERAERVNSEIKQLLGKWDMPRVEAQKLVAFSPQAQRAVNWLQQMEEGTHRAAVYRRIQSAVEGQIPEEAMPGRVRQVVTALRNLADLTGREFERIGLLQVRPEMQEDPQVRMDLRGVLEGTEPEEKAFRAFTRTKEGKIFLRRATPELTAIYTEPSTELSRNPLFDQYVEMIAAENDVEVAEVREIIDAIRRRHFKRVHAEVPRIFKRHPTDMWVDRPDGSRELVPLLWTHPYTYAGAVVSSSAHRSAFVQEFGQQLGDKQLEQAIDRAVQAGINPDDTERLTRALSGIGQPNVIAQPDSPERDMANWFSHLMRFPRATMLTRAGVPNLFEAFGNIQAFGGGPTRFLRAMAQLWPTRYTELRETFARQGLVQSWVMHATVDRQQFLASVPRVYREWLLRVFPTVPMWRLQEMQAAAMGMELAEGLRLGRTRGLRLESDRFVLRHILKFSEEQTQRFVSGNGTDEEYLEVARRFTTRSNTTLLSLPAEESRAAGSRIFNEVFPFHRYSQMKIRSLMNAHKGFMQEVARFGKDRSKANFNRLAGATRTLALYHGGTTAAGSLTYLFLAFLAGGTAGLGVAIGDLKDRPVKFLRDGWIYAQLGPIWTSLARIWTDKRIDNFWMFSAPFSVFKDTMEAVMGWGEYQFMGAMERVGRVFRRISPGPRAVTDFLTAFGLSEKDPQRELAIKRYWQWTREHQPPQARMEWLRAETDYREFRRHMNRAYREMRKRQTGETVEAAREAIRAATTVEGKDRASATRSIRARRLLPRIKDEQVETLKQFMGPELYQAIEEHDAILNRWANAFSPSSGAPRPPRPRRFPRLRRPR